MCVINNAELREVDKSLITGRADQSFLFPDRDSASWPEDGRCSALKLSIYLTSKWLLTSIVPAISTCAHCMLGSFPSTDSMPSANGFRKIAAVQLPPGRPVYNNNKNERTGG